MKLVVVSVRVVCDVDVAVVLVIVLLNVLVSVLVCVCIVLVELAVTVVLEVNDTVRLEDMVVVCVNVVSDVLVEDVEPVNRSSL